jgi:hypothetical protein
MIAWIWCSVVKAPGIVVQLVVPVARYGRDVAVLRVASVVSRPDEGRLLARRDVQVAGRGQPPARRWRARRSYPVTG